MARLTSILGGGDVPAIGQVCREQNVLENIAGDVLACGTTMQWNAPAKS